MKTPWDLSEATLMEQLAEEASELAHAALKLSRVLRAENPTPVRAEDARIKVFEEYADVLLSAFIFGIKPDDKVVLRMCERKMKRWIDRLEDEHA